MAIPLPPCPAGSADVDGEDAAGPPCTTPAPGGPAAPVAEGGYLLSLVKPDYLHRAIAGPPADPAGPSLQER